MAIVQCPNHHYYDDKRNETCPYCEKMKLKDGAGPTIHEQLTSYMEPVSCGDDVQLTEGYGEAVYAYEKTIGIFTDESKNVLTVAWLVCVEGPEKGKSYVIHSGRNFAGSSPDMDIVLPEDLSVAKEKHFSIVYDPKSILFYLVSGAGHTYLNTQAVSAELPISDGDRIRVGESEYVFVPFCRKGRVWD